MTTLMRLAVVCFATLSMVGCGDNTNNGTDGGGGTRWRRTAAAAERRAPNADACRRADRSHGPRHHQRRGQRSVRRSGRTRCRARHVQRRRDAGDVGHERGFPSSRRACPSTTPSTARAAIRSWPAATLDANRYATFATVLADDRIYLDTSQTASVYFGVELHTVDARTSTPPATTRRPASRCRPTPAVARPPST